MLLMLLMLLIGEGTAEIQKMIIGRRLLDRFAAPG
jgi:alkylation response protein AidB-like acyl-CoA dehydrogenase